MIHRRFQGLTLVAALLGPVCLAAEPVAVVTLKPSALVRCRELTLGAVADVASSDAKLAASLRSIQLGKAPWPGHVRLLGAETIKIRLLYQGIKPETVEFRGANVKVRSDAIELTSKRLVELAIDYAKKRLPFAPEDVEVTVLRAPQATMIPRAAQPPEFKVSQQGRCKPWGKVQVLVRAIVGSDEVHHTSVFLHVRVFGPVAVALRDIDRGETFTHDNTGLRRQETTQMVDALNSVQAFIGRKAVKPLRAFTPLALDMIGTDKPVVRRGDVVRMLLEKGGLRIAARAVASEDGRVGETVRVVNVRSKRETFGQVVDSQTVRVIF